MLPSIMIRDGDTASVMFQSQAMGSGPPGYTSDLRTQTSLTTTVGKPQRHVVFFWHAENTLTYTGLLDFFKTQVRPVVLCAIHPATAPKILYPQTIIMLNRTSSTTHSTSTTTANSTNTCNHCSAICLSPLKLS